MSVSSVATPRHDEQAQQEMSNPLPLVRATVRSLLLSTPSYNELAGTRRRKLAEAMVRVCHAAAALIQEEIVSDADARRVVAKSSAPVHEPVHDQALNETGPQPTPFATAQTAGQSFSGVSAARVAGTTQAILNAVSFPRFVTDLINGVFKAMIDSSIQQMNAFVELLNNVAASVEGFADSNLGSDQARAWLAQRYPGSFETVNDSEGDGSNGSLTGGTVLQLRDGASMPSADVLKTDLGLAEGETPPSGDPEHTLLPFARRWLAKKRQEMLATLVMLGMQRIVVDSGRINAAMRFHIDTRSAAQEDQGSTFDWKNQISGSASFGVGAWGASASMTNTIGYVSTQRTQTTEEMNTDLDLSSSVEINFRSDYLPLDRLAGPGQTDRIRANSRNPDAEAAHAAQEARNTRAAAAASDQSRRDALNRALTPSTPSAPAPGSAGTVEAADRARQRAGGQQAQSAQSTRS